ncbi:BT_3928 family protein [Fibrella forsythiae]|uniref:DoxX family protein n=1 Tax=Fibrella forsythiae TaxID=2817061 RepID=A0ABS3JLP1_9BACT|nr:BT_3928 family protein [Fibrella forsythiae]MBO0950931.1 DoxX family protein [Fibrella forsythiae]
MNAITPQPPVKTGTPTMLTVARIARVLVGLLFILSGLIKMNDPVGTQIKMTEYFEVFAEDLPVLAGFFHAFIPYMLYFSVFMCAAEVVLGVALLVSYRPKLTTWLLLLLVGFFTFLTFYSAYFNKVTDCGCFGEALKLKPWTSFTKDVILMVLILFIIGHRNRMKSRKTGWAVFLSFVLSVGLGVWAIQYLSPLDMLPYAVGKSIPVQMKPSEPIRFSYIMTKDGKEYEMDKYPTDTTYKFKEMITLNESAKPKITDYRIWSDTEGDFTEQSFQGNKLFIIVKDPATIDAGTVPAIRTLVNDLKGTTVTPLLLTSASDEAVNAFKKEFLLDIPAYKGDATVLKTIMRADPGTWLLSNGVVRGKWHNNRTPDKAEVLEAVK